MRSTYWSEEGLGHKSRASIEEQLHLRNLLVDLLHKLYYEVDQLVLQHFFGVRIRDQKRDIIALHRLPPQDEERLCSLGKEARELVYQYMLDLVCLFYPYAHSDTVYAWLYQDFLVLISRNGERIEQHFWGCGSFDLGHVMSLGSLRREVG